MIVLDVFYTALATIVIIALLQVVSYFVVRMLHPPEPRIVYRTISQPMAPPPPQFAPPPAFTQPPIEELKLPEYEPREQTSTGLRMDPPASAGPPKAVNPRDEA